MKTEKQYSGRDLLAYMDSRCKMLEKNRRSGTAGIYRSTRNRLKSFKFFQPSVQGGNVAFHARLREFDEAGQPQPQFPVHVA